MKKTILVPESANDLTVRQYVDFQKVDTSDEMFLIHSVLRIFYDIPLSESKNVVFAEAEELAANVLTLVAADHKLQRIVEYKGKEYGFIPNLREISTAEYIDLDTYLADIDNLAKTVSILYRPVTKRKGDLYEVEAYEGSQDYPDFPLGAALGALLFFYRLRRKLLGTSQTSSQKETESK